MLVHARLWVLTGPRGRQGQDSGLHALRRRYRRVFPGSRQHWSRGSLGDVHSHRPSHTEKGWGEQPPLADTLVSQDLLLGFVSPVRAAGQVGCVQPRLPGPGTSDTPGDWAPGAAPAVPWPHLVQQRQLDLLMGDERALLGLPGGRLLGGRGLLRFSAGGGPRGLGQLCGRVPFPLVLFDPIFFFRLSCQQQMLSPRRHPGTALSCGPPEGRRALSQAAWPWDGAGRFLRFPVHPREAAHTLSTRGLPASAATMPGIRGPPVPFSFLVWAGVGDRELAEDTGLARSAYMSSESTLCTELLLDVALDTEETLLTLRDLDTHKHVCTHAAPKARRPGPRGHREPVVGVHIHGPQPPV